jgi:DNA-binding IclR family transcriptional regulator
MSLIEILAETTEGLTLMELSRKLDIPKSSTHYLIYTLSTRGYLQRTSGGRHLLGARFADFANVCPSEFHLTRLAGSTLRRVSRDVNLTATMSILKGAQAVIVNRARSLQDAEGGAWVGRHLDLHCTAQGKALIAAISSREFDSLFSKRELARYTSKTITSLTMLRANLSKVRSSGFAINDEEHVLGVRAVAAPVLDSAGNVAACISVRGLTDEISNTRIQELGKRIMAAARYLSTQISFPKDTC